MHYVIDQSECSTVAICGCGWRGLYPAGYAAAIKGLAGHEKAAHPASKNARAALARIKHAEDNNTINTLIVLTA